MAQDRKLRKDGENLWLTAMWSPDDNVDDELSIQCALVADFLSLSDTFDDLLRHQEPEHSSVASKEQSTNRSRIMSNASYAPPEYVNITISLQSSKQPSQHVLAVGNFATLQ